MTDNADDLDESDYASEWRSEKNDGSEKASDDLADVLAEFAAVSLKASQSGEKASDDLADVLARPRMCKFHPVPSSLLERMVDGGPWLYVSDTSNPGILVFGKATYTDEQINAAFKRARLFKYEIADPRPEWLELLQSELLPTAENTLRNALEYEVPEIVPRGAPEIVPRGAKGVYRPSFDECTTVLRSLWKAMDEIWANDFGEPVPQIPIVTPDYLTAEDQIYNALRTVRAWCARRCNPEASRMRRRNRPTKADRDEEFTRLKDAGNASKDISTWWNNQHPNDPPIDAGIVDTAVSRFRKRKAMES